MRESRLVKYDRKVVNDRATETAGILDNLRAVIKSPKTHGVISLHTSPRNKELDSVGGCLSALKSTIFFKLGAVEFYREYNHDWPWKRHTGFCLVFRPTSLPAKYSTLQPSAIGDKFPNCRISLTYKEFNEFYENIQRGVNKMQADKLDSYLHGVYPKKIIIVGRSGSGKTTLAKRLESRGNVIGISATTREKREGEVNGVSYHFLSRKEFEKKIGNGDMFEHKEFNDNYYGLPLSEWSSSDVIILDPTAVTAMAEKYRNSCTVIYIDIDTSERWRRIKERGGMTQQEFSSREADDDRRFNKFEDFDIHITNPKF